MAELHYIDRGEHLKRRDEILTEMGLRAKIGGQSGNKNAGKDKNEGGIIPPSFKTTKDIAKDIGISESLAHKEKQIATNLDSEVKEKVKGLDLPKNEALELASTISFLLLPQIHFFLTAKTRQDESESDYWILIAFLFFSLHA